MFDKDLYEKICNVTCTLEELKAFFTIKNKKGVPLDISFNLNSILKCLSLYEDGVVSADFVGSWAIAYNSIISREFDARFDDEKEISLSLESLLIWKTTDLLDNLGFFDDIEPYGLSYFKNAFTTLNYIYKSQDKWTVYSLFKTGLWCGGVLLVNDSENLYEYFSVDFCFVSFDFKNCVVENAHPFENFEDKESQLIKNGYKILHTGSK